MRVARGGDGDSPLIGDKTAATGALIRCMCVPLRCELMQSDGCVAEGEVVGVSDADGSAEIVQVAVPVVEGAEVSVMASLVLTLELDYTEQY